MRSIAEFHRTGVAAWETLREIACAACVARHLTPSLALMSAHFAQFVYREVNQVSDRASHILGHACFDREIAVSKRAYFIQQTQNRFLVTLVLTFVFQLPETRASLRNNSREQRSNNERIPSPAAR